MTRHRTLTVHLVFSFIAGVLILFFIITAPVHPPSLSFIEKLVIAGIFLFCCGTGIFFAIYPNRIRKYISKNTTNEADSPLIRKRLFRGHHPDCSTFQAHTIQWKNKTWCAGCLGLFIGLCLSMVFMIVYLGIEVQLTKTLSLLLFLLAVCIVITVYIEIWYPRKSPYAHLIFNSLLPFSFFLITLDVGVITGQLVYVLFTILLCVLWLDTRIQFSRLKHSFLCAHCASSCKMFLEKSLPSGSDT